MPQLENAEIGENITAPAMVYISSSDGKVYKATATDLAKGAQGSLLVSGSTGDNRQVHFGSEAIAWPSPLTAGAVFYLSDTAGAITATAPTNVQVVGFATAYGLFQQSIAPFASGGGGGGGASHLVYTALLNQSGTSAPVATVLENTLGGTVVWSYNGSGDYYATLTGAFDAANTFIYFGSNDSGATFGQYIIDADSFAVISPNGDGALINTAFEIRVY